ncbi:hypothetical protein [Desulfohalovibrio reitneri]|uniref:hypothetical protein n=1 Tax=Desulfohalovibrio reitneri TaxID=1307759 RepID=UPI000689498E|nr:hypothetical protein [Desulfohalovibrio reitneri]
MQPSLAVVILHYGDPAVTSALHRQLLDTDPAWADRIHVLDNAAPQPYPDAWKRLPENIYWKGGLEFCLDHFRKAGCSHLWFLNNDLTFRCPPPVIERAWQRLRVLDRALGEVGAYHPALTHNVYHPQMAQDGRLQVSRVRLLDGVAPLLNLAAVERAGGLDAPDNPVGYGVELWLSHRLDMLGYPLVVDHQVWARHAYHKAAGNDERFWKLAHACQDVFLKRTFGEDARERIKALQEQREDFAAMPKPRRGGA